MAKAARPDEAEGDVINGYERPQVWELGGVHELTLMPAPPGKTGPVHDASQFLSNFSCVVDGTPGSNCGDH